MKNGLPPFPRCLYITTTRERRQPILHSSLFILHFYKQFPEIIYQEVCARETFTCTVAIRHAASLRSGTTSHLYVEDRVSHDQYLVSPTSDITQDVQHHVRLRLGMLNVRHGHYTGYILLQLHVTQKARQGVTATAAGYRQCHTAVIQRLHRLTDMRKHRNGSRHIAHIKQPPVDLRTPLPHLLCHRNETPETFVQRQTYRRHTFRIRTLWKPQLRYGLLHRLHNNGAGVSQRPVKIKYYCFHKKAPCRPPKGDTEWIIG